MNKNAIEFYARNPRDAEQKISYLQKAKITSVIFRVSKPKPCTMLFYNFYDFYDFMTFGHSPEDVDSYPSPGHYTASRTDAS